MSKIEVVDETVEKKAEKQKSFLEKEDITHSVVIDIDTRSRRWISMVYTNEEKILKEKNEDVPRLSVAQLAEYFLSVIQFLTTSKDVDSQGNIITKREKEFDEFLKQAKDKKDTDED